MMEERKSKARLGCANAASKHSILAASDICRVQRQTAPFIVQTPCKRMVQVGGGQKRCLHTSACYAVCYAVCKWLVGSLRHAARPEGQAPLQQSTLNQLSTQSARRQTVFLGSRPASRPQICGSMGAAGMQSAAWHGLRQLRKLRQCKIMCCLLQLQERRCIEEQQCS